MIGVLVAHIAMTQSGDVKICGDLFHFNTSVYSTGWSALHFLVCWPVRSVLLLDPTLLLAGKEFAYPGQSASLVWRTTFGRVDDIVSGRIGRRTQPGGQRGLCTEH